MQLHTISVHYMLTRSLIQAQNAMSASSSVLNQEGDSSNPANHFPDSRSATEVNGTFQTPLQKKHMYLGYSSVCIQYVKPCAQILKQRISNILCFEIILENQSYKFLRILYIYIIIYLLYNYIYFIDTFFESNRKKGFFQINGGKNHRFISLQYQTLKIFLTDSTCNENSPSVFLCYLVVVM